MKRNVILEGLAPSQILTTRGRDDGVRLSWPRGESELTADYHDMNVAFKVTEHPYEKESNA